MRLARSNSKRLWCSLVGATALLIATPALSAAESIRFDIASQPLPAALQAFAAQAHMELLYEHTVVAGLVSNAISGELERRAALELLLRGSGLEVVYSSDSAATIRLARDDENELAAKPKMKPIAE